MPPSCPGGSVTYARYLSRIFKAARPSICSVTYARYLSNTFIIILFGLKPGRHGCSGLREAQHVASARFSEASARGTSVNQLYTRSIRDLIYWNLLKFKVDLQIPTCKSRREVNIRSVSYKVKYWIK